MIAQDNILVVVDSAHSEHLALNRAVNFAARQRHSAMTVHVIVGFEGHDLSESDHTVEVTRGQDWLNQLLAPLEESGVKFEVRLLWTRNWEKSIIDAARRTEADAILITQSSALNKQGITDSCWSLLRNSEILCSKRRCISKPPDSKRAEPDPVPQIRNAFLAALPMATELQAAK